MATNSGVAQDVENSSVAADQLRSIIERIERLEEEKAGIAGDIKDVYAEAKANGFDTKTIRKIISLRKKDHDERMEEEAVLDLYMGALGMLSDTPLGQSAISREVAASEVTITYGDTKVTTTGAKLAEATARVRLDKHATAGRGSLKQRLGDSLKAAFGEENVVFNATIPRSGAGTMRAAAKRMRGGQTDIEDAIAARG